MQKIRLIPYGSTTLRIAAFPTVSGGAAVARHDDLVISASYVFENDRLTALHDGSTADMPRHTFWPRRGTTEWLQYGFDEPREVSRVTLHWYDDTGRGSCRPPASWHLFVQDGDQWKPVDTSENFTTHPHRANTVTFAPVTTTALRIEVELRENFSAGVREWEFE